MRTLCGTKYYLAPEIVRGESYSIPCDVWSLGVILFTMCCGFLPFDHDNEVLLMKTISLGMLKMPTFLSADLQDLIRKILNPNQHQRMTVSTIMQHPWFTRLNDELERNKGQGGKAPPIRFKIEQALEENRKFQVELCENASKITLSSCIKARYNIQTDERVHSRIQTPVVSMDSKADGEGRSNSSMRMRAAQFTGSEGSMRSPRGMVMSVPKTPASPTTPQSAIGSKIANKANKMGEFLKKLQKKQSSDASGTSRSSRAPPSDQICSPRNPNSQPQIPQGRRRIMNPTQGGQSRDQCWSPSRTSHNTKAKKRLDLQAQNKFQYTGKDRHVVLNKEVPISPLARRRDIDWGESKMSSRGGTAMQKRVMKAKKVQFEEAARVAPGLVIPDDNEVETKKPGRKRTVTRGIRTGGFVQDEKRRMVRCESPSMKFRELRVSDASTGSATPKQKYSQRSRGFKIAGGTAISGRLKET